MSQSESCLLFHGPRAQDRASLAASSWGRVVGLFGHPIDGLNAETVREAVAALVSPPVGDQRGAVVIGPVDVVTVVGIEDALLKGIEEFRDDVIRPYLWAHDLGEVRATIRSRCLDIWSPGILPPSASRDAAEEVIRCTRTRNIPGLIDALGSVEVWKSTGEEVLRCISEVLAEDPKPDNVVVWLRARALLHHGGDGVPLHEAVAGFLP